VNTPAERAPIRRILVALDASRASLAALEAATRLAARLEAELLGLFVEDVNLLRLAALPFARELGVASARVRRIESADMEQALRAQAARAQAALSTAAARQQVRWSFRVTRGQVVAELLAAAEKADLMALGFVGGELLHRVRLGSTARAVAAEAARPLLILPPGACIRAPVLTLYDGAPPARRALRLATDLAGEEDGNLIVLIVAADEKTGKRLEKEINAGLSGRAGKVHYRRLTPREVADLARAVRAEAAGTLVLAPSRRLTEDVLRRILEQTGCAVLLSR
jgi:nucleotide-binding universal stress UspA family protein